MKDEHVDEEVTRIHVREGGSDESPVTASMVVDGAEGKVALQIVQPLRLPFHSSVGPCSKDDSVEGDECPHRAASGLVRVVSWAARVRAIAAAVQRLCQKLALKPA